jgi:hypothetical protein
MPPHLKGHTMRFATVLAVTAMLAVSACAETAIPVSPPYVEQPSTGGPCGDGTVLKPGTHCP